MSNPYIYLYPDSDGPLLAVDLGEGLSRRREIPRPDRVVARGSDGHGWSSQTAFSYEVTISLDAFGSAAASALERKLQLVANHLNRGGLIGFSRDHAKTWGLVSPLPVRTGTSVLTVPGNGFGSWSASGTLSAGDEVVIETGHPENRRDIVTVTSLSATTLTLAESARCTFRYTPLIRWRDFWPVLYSDPADGEASVDIVQTTGFAYNLEMTLRYAPSLAWALANGGSPPIGLTGQVSPLGALGLRDATASVGVVQGCTIEGAIHPRMWRFGLIT